MHKVFHYPRHHGVDGGEVGFALGAPVDALTRKISTVAHAHLRLRMKVNNKKSEEGVAKGTRKTLYDVVV